MLRIQGKDGKSVKPSAPMILRSRYLYLLFIVPKNF